MTDSKDPIQSLQEKIRLLTFENSMLAERAEELSLLSVITEDIDNYDSYVDILDTVLERLSILLQIPFCGCFTFKNYQWEQVCVYTSFAEEKDVHGIGLLNMPDAVVGSLIEKPYLAPLEDWKESIHFEIEHFMFKPGYIGIISFNNSEPQLEQSIIVLVDDAANEDALLSRTLLLQQTVNFVVKRIEKLHLIHELVTLNNELDRRVVLRTEMLEKEIETRKKAELQLEKSEEKYRELFSKIKDGAYLWSIGPDIESTRCLEVNDEACQMLGYTYEEMRGFSLKDILSPDQVNAGIQNLETVSAENRLVFESALKKKDGTLIQVEISSHKFTLQGENVILSMARDITKRKQAERENLQIQKKMQHAQKLESLGILSGGIAHDFNNLIMSVIGNVELAKLTISENDPMHKFLGNIEHAGERASELCNQLLAYSGKGAFIVEPLNLSEITRGMADLLKISVSKKARIKLDLDDHVKSISADKNQIHQIIMNLIINASDALENQQGEICVSTGMVEGGTISDEHCYAGLPENQEYAFFKVQDNGCGMDRETCNRIFDPFFTTKSTGRGLGLSAVHGILKNNKSFLTVESEVGTGTTMVAYFPATAPFAAGLEFQKAACVGGVDLKGKTVLLVDDDSFILELGRQILEVLGINPLTAEDGLEAIAKYRQRENEIDCVILDLTMPELSGEETFLELQTINPDVKVIIASGYTKEEISEPVSSRIAGFIRKPYKINDIVTALTSIL